jgi:hypothetical protein
MHEQYGGGSVHIENTGFPIKDFGNDGKKEVYGQTPIKVYCFPQRL